MTSTPSLRDKTHCRNGHDLSIPGATRPHYRGRDICLQCERDRKAARTRVNYKTCAWCKCAQRPSESRFCSDVCKMSWRAMTSKKATGASCVRPGEADIADRILKLSVQLESAAPYDREWIRQRIYELQDEMASVRAPRNVQRATP